MLGPLVVAAGAIVLVATVALAIASRFFQRAAAEFEALLDGPVPELAPRVVEREVDSAHADAAADVRDRRLAAVNRFGERVPHANESTRRAA